MRHINEEIRWAVGVRFYRLLLIWENKQKLGEKFYFYCNFMGLCYNISTKWLGYNLKRVMLNVYGDGSGSLYY